MTPDNPTLESATLTPSDAPGTPTLRQQIGSLPAYVLNSWRARYANEGTDLEARAIIDREAAAIRARGETPDAVAVWMRLANAAGQTRDAPPTLIAGAALAGLAAGIRTQGFEAPSSADPASPAELDVEGERPG